MAVGINQQDKRWEQARLFPTGSYLFLYTITLVILVLYDILV